MMNHSYQLPRCLFSNNKHPCSHLMVSWIQMVINYICNPVLILWLTIIVYAIIGYGKTYEVSDNLCMPSNMCPSWLPVENDFSLGDMLDDECSWLATPQSHKSLLTTPPPPSLTCGSSSPCFDDFASSQPSIYSQQHTPQLAWTSSSTSAESSIGSVSCNQSLLYNNGPVNNTADYNLLCLSPPQSCSTSASTLAQLVNGLSVDASPTPTASDGMLLQPWLEQQVYAQQQQQPPTPQQPEQPRAKKGRQTSAAKKKPVRRTRHTCPFCFHTSNRANNMKEHIMTHYPDRPKDFKCNLCDKAFARKHDMKRHLKTHERRRKPRYPGTLLFC